MTLDELIEKLEELKKEVGGEIGIAILTDDVYQPEISEVTIAGETWLQISQGEELEW